MLAFASPAMRTVSCFTLPALPSVNFLVVLVAAAASFVSGAVYWGIIAKPLTKLLGGESEPIKMPPVGIIRSMVKITKAAINNSSAIASNDKAFSFKPLAHGLVDLMSRRPKAISESYRPPFCPLESWVKRVLDRGLQHPERKVQDNQSFAVPR